MINNLKIEFIKIKNGLMAIIIIITIAPLYNGISVSDKLSAVDSNPNKMEAIYDFSINPYTLMILPTIIILTFAVIIRIERLNGGLKEIFTLPVTKKQLFLSKLMLGVLLVGISLFSFFIFLFAATFFQNGVTMKSTLLILSRIVVIFLVSLGGIAVQFYLSIIYDNISVPLGLGFCLLMPSFLLSGSKYAVFYPFSYITTVNDITGIDLITFIMITISVVLFVVVNLAGYIRFKNKDIC